MGVDLIQQDYDLIRGGSDTGALSNFTSNREGRLCEVTVRRHPYASQGEKLQEKPWHIDLELSASRAVRK